MSMNSTAPFEGEVNVDSMIRRLKNVKRERRKAEKNNAKVQPGYTADTIDPSKPDPELASLNSRKEYENLGATNTEGPVSQQASGYTTPDDEDLFDENGNIRPDATLVGEDGERRNLNDIVARINDPNKKWAFGSLNDEGVRTWASFKREEEEENRRKGISISPRPDSPAHSSQSSSSTGYIPPPEERTPGGTRKWNYRDYLAGRLPMPKNHQDMKDVPKVDFQLPAHHKPDSDGVVWFKRDKKSRDAENSEGIGRSDRDLETDSFDRRYTPRRERKKDIEIRVKLQLGVDPLLLGISENNRDDDAISLSVPQPSRSTRKYMKRDDHDMASPTPKIKSDGSIQGLFERGLRVETVILIIILAIMVGYMAGSNVCR